MDIDWAFTASIVTIVSTGVLVVAGVGRRVYSQWSKAIQSRAIDRMNRCPTERVEIVNIRRYNGNGKLISILVRNRSQVQVFLRDPIFEIRGNRSQLPGSVVQHAALAPGDTKSFLMEFTNNIADASHKYCVLVDTGRQDQA